MKVDRCDTDVRVEGVFVEENRTARKVGHVKSIVLEEYHVLHSQMPLAE